MTDHDISRALIALLLGPPTLLLGCLVALAVAAHGCGAAQQDIDYAQELARCYSHQRDIVAREGTTEAQDFADYELETRRCDDVLDAMEAAE